MAGGSRLTIANSRFQSRRDVAITLRRRFILLANASLKMEDEEDAPVPQSRTAFVARFFNQVHFYRKLLLRYWWIPCVAIGLGLVIEWLVLKHVPPSFVSNGRMIVNARLSIPNANVYNEELAYFYGTQVALMQSDLIGCDWLCSRR